MGEYAGISGILRENVGPLMSVGETDGIEKAEWLHAFFAFVFRSKIFCTSIAGGGEGQQGIGEQQVRDCLEELNVFKTLDPIRLTWGCWKGWLRWCN